MVNQGGSEAGLPGCAAKTALPILQDDAANAVRTILGAAYNATLVVDAEGRVVALLENLSLSVDAQKLVDAVVPLL
jgi:hypothetical protein